VAGTFSVGAIRLFDGINDQVVAPAFGPHHYHSLSIDPWIRLERVLGCQALLNFGSFRYAPQQVPCKFPGGVQRTGAFSFARFL
jgi:hypothetical protein